jgi:hypothetical protein
LYLFSNTARVSGLSRGHPPPRATPQISDRVPGIGTHHQGWPRPALPPPRTTPSLRPPRQNGPSPFGWRPNVHPTPPGSANSRREATPASPTRPSRRAPTASRNHLLPTATTALTREGRSGRRHRTALTLLRERTSTLEATASPPPSARSVTAHAHAGHAPPGSWAVPRGTPGAGVFHSPRVRSASRRHCSPCADHRIAAPISVSPKPFCSQLS